MYLLSGIVDESLKEIVSADLAKIYPDYIQVELEYSTGEASYEDVPSKVIIIVLEDTFVNFEFKEMEYKERYPSLEQILYFCFNGSEPDACKEAVCFENHLSYKTWLKGQKAMVKVTGKQHIPEFHEQFEKDPVIQDKNTMIEQEEDVVEVSETNQDNKNIMNWEEKILILKESLAPPIWQRTRTQKTIAIWSPITNVGVSTFVINFALYLSKMPISVGVIEMLGTNYRIKSLLKQYSTQPQNWHSFSTYLFEENINPTDVKWEYAGVNWYPVNPAKDMKYEWDEKSLYLYFNAMKFNDVLLMDLPTGKLENFIESQLSSVNELWILVNNQVHQVLEWKDHIKQLEKKGISCHLVFHRDHSITQKEQLAERLGIPIIAAIPDMHHQMINNEYQNYPLIKQRGAEQVLEDGYKNLTMHLFGIEPDNPKSMIHTIKNVKDKIQRGLIWKSKV
ncbi:hypothetical protein LCY76_23470 [Fictibacillus sp. KIGAM418]|uniref:Uncharacterized protein n=1 Tax=Fictibacillus marinisediminis TaxID=2878389 RepID=A0A9X1XEW1_9BACL|nr:hypothetical protein [Fictibacillus marinisediminis]MCK6259534.1 hypothetical protein [Fictibacillus marinisediminis]